MGKIRKLIHVLVSIKYKILCFRFGNLSYIIKPIFIQGKKNISIGNKVSIWHGARIEAVQRYNNKSFQPQIIIEDNVKIQQNFHCTCAERVLIGNGTAITQNVGIFDITHPYYNVKVSPISQNIQHKEVVIGENCLIGMNSVILPGTKLGNHTIVGANSVVNITTEGYCVIAGSPAAVIKRYNFETGKWERVKAND
jgi:acetyltransferase-like isoleucine patch superfamily enzyme